MQVLLTIFSLIATVYVVPHVLDNYSKWPIGYLVPVIVIGSLAYLYFAHSRRNEKGAFLASCAYIVGMLVGAAFALYPNVLPASTGAQYSLTIYNTAAGAHGLAVGFVWWTLGMIIAARILRLHLPHVPRQGEAGRRRRARILRRKHSRANGGLGGRRQLRLLPGVEAADHVDHVVACPLQQAARDHAAIAALAVHGDGRILTRSAAAQP